jgi:hypothetical protein
MTLTIREEWFPAGTKPARSGVYKRRYVCIDTKRKVQKWSYFHLARQEWGVLSCKHHLAKLTYLSYGASTNQNLPWCGLVEVEK